MNTPFAGLLPEALLIDLPEIDAQHDEIFGRVEALKAACYGSGPAPLEDFQSLLDYVQFHFSTEEGMARETGVDFLDHGRVHRENLQSLYKAFGEVRAGARDVHSFLRYAEYWFERHIIEEDKAFAVSVRACRLKSPSTLPPVFDSDLPF